MGVVWKRLENLPEESLESCKQSLLGNSGWNSEDGNAGKNVDSKARAQEISDENKESIGNWSRSHSCYTSAPEGPCRILDPWDSFHFVQPSRHTWAVLSLVSRSQTLFLLVADLGVYLMLPFRHAYFKKYGIRVVSTQTSNEDPEGHAVCS